MRIYIILKISNSLFWKTSLFDTILDYMWLKSKGKKNDYSQPSVAVSLMKCMLAEHSSSKKKIFSQKINFPIDLFLLHSTRERLILKEQEKLVMKFHCICLSSRPLVRSHDTLQTFYSTCLQYIYAWYHFNEIVSYPWAMIFKFNSSLYWHD